MKKIIALIAAIAMVLSLVACGGSNNNGSTADQANAADVSTYDKDFEGLQKYITDRNSSAAKNELFYDMVGADNGIRLVLNGNAYVEIYDYSKADNDTAKSIIEDVKDDNKFKPVADGAELAGKLTNSGKYVLAWDTTRSYDYDKKVVTEELLENW